MDIYSGYIHTSIVENSMHDQLISTQTLMQTHMLFRETHRETTCALVRFNWLVPGHLVFISSISSDIYSKPPPHK